MLFSRGDLPSVPAEKHCDHGHPAATGTETSSPTAVVQHPACLTLRLLGSLAPLDWSHRGQITGQRVGSDCRCTTGTALCAALPRGRTLLPELWLSQCSETGLALGES